MAWNTSVPASSDSPSGSCKQFQDNWAAIEAWGDTEHAGPASANAGEHLLVRDKVYTFTYRSTLATGTDATTSFRVPYSCEITKAYAYVRTAPTGANLILDINIDGVSIWSPADRLKILAGATTGSAATFDYTALEDGDILTLDIDQVGSSVAGADLTVELKVGQTT